MQSTRTTHGRLALSLILLAASAMTTAHARGAAVVTSAADSGPGTLRAALEEGASRIVVPGRVGDIEIFTTLTYAGRAPLIITGSGQTVFTGENVTLLAVTDGADLTIRNLNFEGPGGFDIQNRGDLTGPAGKGIFVDVRDDQTGKVRVNLSRVSVKGVANHGIHVSDCSLADDCGGGSGGGGEGSPASIYLTCTNCKVEDAGNGRFDADGIRIDERGPGSIYAILRSSSFNGVGADGVEVDEGNDGGVHITAIRSDFSGNGGYCDPALLASFLPDPDEAEFDESEQVTEADIPGPVTGSPDDRCFEREVDLYDSGFVEAYEFAIDVDDGIDGDEAGDGSLWVLMVNSTIDDNLDEGVDMDEEDAGDIVATYVASSADYNADDAFKHSEEGEGGVFGFVRASSALYNGGVGFVFEEEDDGDVQVYVRGTTTVGNDDGELGIEAVQEDDGAGVLSVRGSNITEDPGIEVDGVELR